MNGNNQELLVKMNKWKTYKLGEIVDVLGDGIHGTPIYNEVGDYYFINGNNLGEGYIKIKENTLKVDEKEYLKHKKNLTNRTLLLSINGTLGNVAKYRGEPCILGKSACYLNISESCERDFIYYIMISPLFRRDLENMATGTTIKNVSLKALRNYEISLPPLAEQKRIADILGAIDDKIELNRRINANLEQQAQALYKSWFVDFEPFGGKMPEDWREGTLGEICTELKEKVHDRDDVKVLSPVATGQLMLSEEFFTKQVYSKSIAKYIVVPQNCFAYNPARVNIGSLGMNEFDFDGCVSPVYVVFRCQNGYEYFFDLFRHTKPFKEEVKLRAIGGVRQTLSYDDFARIQINIPTYNVIQDFNKIYLTNLDVRWHNQYEILRLAHLRDTLLPKLMSGEITI